MTSLEIYQEIENSKTKDWKDIIEFIDNPSHIKILTVIAELLIEAKDVHNYKSIYAGGIEFNKYMNQTLKTNKKNWNEVVDHHYLKSIIDIKDLGALIIYEDIKGNICLDLIKSTKKGNGTILMNMFLDVIDRLGYTAITVPACIDDDITANSEKEFYNKIWKKTMGLRKWSIEFNWKPCKYTPKLIYKS